MKNSEHIIAIARSWRGTPYRHQASLKGVGCDCLGLIRGVWREVYGSEPEQPPAYAPDWAEASKDEPLTDAARRYMTEVSCADVAPADVVLFRWRPWLPAKHAGIAIDRTRMIHAQDGLRVCEVPLSPWWHRRMAYAFRFPEKAQ